MPQRLLVAHLQEDPQTLAGAREVKELLLKVRPTSQPSLLLPCSLVVEGRRGGGPRLNARP